MENLENFRSEVKVWLDENCPPSMRNGADPSIPHDEVWGGRNAEYKNPESKIWLDRMGAKGWTMPTVPKQYGGGGLNKDEVKILNEEMFAIGAKTPLLSFGIWMLAPVLLEYGSEEQKKEHLPKIIKGEIRWCQGYSEPGSGSDLASLATKAEDKGDHFVVNGQKVWTSYADKADWIFALVRTGPQEPKHDGISFLLIDMETKGVSTKPITLISGKSPFCETFFDDVEVPKDNIVGKLNAGWEIAKKLLQHERKFISNFGLAAAAGSKKDIISIAKKHFGEVDGKIGNSFFRSEIADHKIKEHAFGLTLKRAGDEGGKASAVASMFKYYGTEHNKKRHELMIAAMGKDGVAWDGDEFAQEDKNLTRSWLRTKGNSIEGGTSEVQLNVISKEYWVFQAKINKVNIMKLVLNEEQQFLKDTAKNFAAERTPINHFRNLRDSKDSLLWDKDIWQEMVNLGWSGILIPEEYGGSDFGITGMSVVLQECGKTLTPSPLFATAVLGAYALKEFGNEEQKSKYLPLIADGSITTAIAIDESSHHDPANTELEAKVSNAGFSLNGKKQLVVDGASADLLMVLARTSGVKGDIAGLTLFVVDSSSEGVSRTKLDMADSRNYANIEFNNVEVDSASVLGSQEAGGEAIEHILDIGRIALSAEMLGNSEAAFSTTVDYLKERKQFGVLIGTFQALQHRAAEMFCEIELTKSSVMAAMQGADENSNQLQVLASLAKSMAGDTLHLVSNEAIQMHGGIGVTDEYDLGFFLKRARVAEQIFGSVNFHKERYANLSGF